MKKSEQSWEYKYNRSDLVSTHYSGQSLKLCCNLIAVVFMIRMSSENKILTNSLQEIESENQQLRAENSGKY